MVHLPVLSIGGVGLGRDLDRARIPQPPGAEVGIAVRGRCAHQPSDERDQKRALVHGPGIGACLHSGDSLGSEFLIQDCFLQGGSLDSASSE